MIGDSNPEATMKPVTADSSAKQNNVIHPITPPPFSQTQQQTPGRELLESLNKKEINSSINSIRPASERGEPNAGTGNF
jgi:hypothetical protein